MDWRFEKDLKIRKNDLQMIQQIQIIAFTKFHINTENIIMLTVSRPDKFMCDCVCVCVSVS